MGLWLKVHREVTGAWRSACYDVGPSVTARVQPVADPYSLKNPERGQSHVGMAGS